MKNILFRADSSSTIGTGHIMRDLVLASQYRNSNIVFAVRDLDENINNKIKESGYCLEIIKSNDLTELIDLINKYAIDLVVFDHYDIDYEYEKTLKEKTGVTILSFDDTYEKHYCDILLNHNIGANQKKYKGLVPSGCELRCGPKYTLLRDEFRNEKTRFNFFEKKKMKTVFIAMGGADSFNINIKILKILKPFKDLKINLVTTSANRNLDSLKKYISKNRNVHMHINSNEIARLINNSDFAIITPSVIVNEIVFMRLPFIAIYVTDNQKEIYEYLKLSKFYCLKSDNIIKIISFVKKLNISSNYHKNMLLLHKIERKMK